MTRYIMHGLFAHLPFKHVDSLRHANALEKVFPPHVRVQKTTYWEHIGSFSFNPQI